MHVTILIWKSESFRRFRVRLNSQLSFCRQIYYRCCESLLCIILSLYLNFLTASVFLILLMANLKALCDCGCGQVHSRKTRLRHLNGIAAKSVLISQQIKLVRELKRNRRLLGVNRRRKEPMASSIVQSIDAPTLPSNVLQNTSVNSSSTSESDLAPPASPDAMMSDPPLHSHDISGLPQDSPEENPPHPPSTTGASLLPSHDRNQNVGPHELQIAGDNLPSDVYRNSGEWRFPNTDNAGVSSVGPIDPESASECSGDLSDEEDDMSGASDDEYLKDDLEDLDEDWIGNEPWQHGMSAIDALAEEFERAVAGVGMYRRRRLRLSRLSVCVSQGLIFQKMTWLLSVPITSRSTPISVPDRMLSSRALSHHSPTFHHSNSCERA